MLKKPQKNENKTQYFDIDKVLAKNTPKVKSKGKNDYSMLDSSLLTIDAIERAVELLKERALKLRQSGLPLPVMELNRTVAIMPFLGSDMGAGHSKLGKLLTNTHSLLTLCLTNLHTTTFITTICEHTFKSNPLIRYLAQSSPFPTRSVGISSLLPLTLSNTLLLTNLTHPPPCTF